MSQASQPSQPTSPSGSGHSSPRLPVPETKGRNLILCFDGTGNSFSGSNADTNVVKLLYKLERNDPNQFHYYQTGIGTYDVSSTTVDKSWLASILSSVSQTMDEGFGTGFDAHVMAGYRFLMRYYESGDRIFMFGFSRGAFTAKFLARMIHTVGLLCRGNEEMVPFAYRLYQRYLAGQTQLRREGDRRNTIYDSPHDPMKNKSMKHDEIISFSNTFCRKERVEKKGGKPEEDNIKVFFLGMWDCVSSVAVLERKAPRPVPTTGTAQFVRHAVAVDERRVKFKATLLAQDKPNEDEEEDIKEVWFPGCHGDVGGGWPASRARRRNMTVWQRIKKAFKTRKAKHVKDIDAGPLQMSDIPLAWMIHELEQIGAGIKWRQPLVDKFQDRLHKNMNDALHGGIHDSLRYRDGIGLPKVLFWKFLEWFPLISRWELTEDGWSLVRFPLNKGAARDIPLNATLHESLIWRLRHDSAYLPRNNHGDNSSPCLNQVAEFEGPDHTLASITKTGPSHEVYNFKRATEKQLV